MKPHQFLLYPFSLLYDGLTRLRNKMFDRGVKKSVVFEIPTIVVGNLSMGGTGKTPMVEFLLTEFREMYEVAMLSRGYGRNTKGFILANSQSTPEKIGDEPYQIFQKFGEEVAVAVGEQRVLAIPRIIENNPATELLVLDDAFQHRYVKGDFNILLTTYQKPFFNDHVLPMGTLRENPNGAKRANVVVVTKCPDNLAEKEKNYYIEGIHRFTKKHCPVVFASLNYGQPYNIWNGEPEELERVILLSGIANPKVLYEYVKGQYELLDFLEYGDHYNYSEKDVEDLLLKYKAHLPQNTAILTTEKDAVKLKADKFLKYLGEIPIFALPVQVKFEEKDKHALLELASKAIREKGYQSER
ncbi:tetraacyldisaccharide 4'-kinase [Echinicola jeungdonensis]|uniref:Tetraacyldisaccharide 4'-kinase n=1 Tax=Echinicola jeungdonensis TaxID=709343 RepID=A0ABV5J5K4_9BACT|nr:tetraacyldisaccharide 4'-kinase [Echinicola jeungdonensis]MDN3670106.1 tetraacyldisaccharide 4'-kinase [Echinicola jeungdonensis]